MNSTAVMSGYEVAARELVRGARIRDLFGVVGDDTISLTTEMIDAGARYHPARHEAAAVGMADGYAWATGELGVCLVTRGPGLVNALTAARTAARGHRRVLIVTGEAAPGDHTADVKYVDAAVVVRGAGLEYIGAPTSGVLVSALREALSAAYAGRTAVLAIGDDVLAGAAGTGRPFSAEPALTPAAPAEIAPTGDQVQAIADPLRAAAHPLLLAGGGAADAETCELLSVIAERTGARLGTTMLARDAFTGHPHNLGLVGGFASDSAVDALGGIDCVVAFGAGLNHFTTAERTLFTDATVIQVDTDPAALGRHLPVDIAVLAAARATAVRLLDALEPEPATNGAELFEIGTPCYMGADESNGDGLDPRAATAAIAALLPAERSVVVDSGRFMGWPARFVPVPGPGRFRLAAEFGAIGGGLGIALGVSAARPAEATVLFVGDGGLSNLIGDLETAAHCVSPLLIVVLNDSSYAAEFRVQRIRGLRTELAALRAVDFAAVARGFGLAGETVRTIAEIDALAERIRTLEGPLLIDCKIRELDIDSLQRWGS
jgi:thiamine pyrophosphate-dependent acetolactate synthase large subunit-like protein